MSKISILVDNVIAVLAGMVDGEMTPSFALTLSRPGMLLLLLLLGLGFFGGAIIPHRNQDGGAAPAGIEIVPIEPLA